MGMCAARVALELLEHRVAERTFGKHAADGFLERSTRKPRLHLTKIGRADAARITAMAMIELRFGLVSGDAQAVDVGHNDEIARVDVGGVDRLVLAAQPRGDCGGETTQHFVGPVNDVSVPLDVAGLCGIGLHENPKRCNLQSRLLYCFSSTAVNAPARAISVRHRAESLRRARVSRAIFYPAPRKTGSLIKKGA